MSEGETYLKRFRSYLERRTDAPKDFHMHAGLVTLAVAIGNRAWMDGPARNIYPNLLSVVLAPSGMGKSVPLDMAEAILNRAGMGCHVLPGSFSQEALLDALKDQPNGLFLIQEFAAFQALLGREYNDGLEKTLTELSDAPQQYIRKLRSASYRIEGPILSILGASSPDWFAHAFKGADLRGGWLARFLFCPSRDAGKPIGYPGPRDDLLEARLAKHLVEVRQHVSGKFAIGHAQAMLEDYAIRKRLEARESTDFGGMRSRAPVMAQKVAMLFHVSREPSTELDERDMEAAIRFVEHTHGLAEKYLIDEVAHDKKEADRLRIMDLVHQRGGRAPWSDVLRYSHMDARDFETAVKTLEQSDRLRCTKEGRQRYLEASSENSQFTVNSRESVNSRNGHTRGEVPAGAAAV